MSTEIQSTELRNTELQNTGLQNTELRNTELHSTELQNIEIEEAEIRFERTTNGTIRTIVTEDDAGMTVGNFLTKRLGFTRMQVKRMKFMEDGITVNGIRSRVTGILKAGDVLEGKISSERKSGESGASAAEFFPADSDDKQDRGLYLDKDEKPAGKSENSLQILYEDQDVIALWKEAGIVVHPAHGHYGDTLSDQLAEYFRRKNEPVSVRSIGRLDKDTAGILVFAKNQVSAERLWKQREEGRFWKEYEAVCEGVFEDISRNMPERIPEDISRNMPEKIPEDISENMSEKITRPLSRNSLSSSGIQKEYRVDAPIAPVPGELMKMQIDAQGKRAVTYYRVIRQDESTAVVHLRLLTGRTHQIRVHMAALGHPLVGDPLYGNGIPGVTHAQLTAFRAEFRQPFTNERIEIFRHPAQ